MAIRSAAVHICAAARSILPPSAASSVENAPSCFYSSCMDKNHHPQSDIASADNDTNPHEGASCILTEQVQLVATDATALWQPAPPLRAATANEPQRDSRGIPIAILYGPDDAMSWTQETDRSPDDPSLVGANMLTERPFYPNPRFLTCQTAVLVSS